MKKTAFITGASSGIGAACARRFSKEGYNLIILARRKDVMENLVKELVTHTHIIDVDIKNSNELEGKLLQLPTELKDIDVLVNCAGITLGEGPIHKAQLSDWMNMIDVNIKGVITCTRILLPGMVERNKGHIINIGSTAGTYPRPGNPIYVASKAFTKQFSLALRADLKGLNVRVTSIEPGTVKNTELALGRLGNDRNRLKSLYDGYDYLEPEDIAESVFWVTQLPSRVNINRIDLMATCQTFGNLQNHKKEI